MANKLINYTNNLAKEMGLDVNLKIILDRNLENGGKNGLSGKEWQVWINPRYYKRKLLSSLSAIKHELGHIYFNQKYPTLDKILDALRLPFDLIGKKFNKHNEVNENLAMGVALISEGAAIISYSTEANYIAAPLMSLSLILIIPSCVDEGLAYYFGWRYGRKVKSQNKP